MVSQSPLLMEKKKLLLPWSPRQNEDSWPAITRVWIRLRGIPYHCWSSDILLSIASYIGKPFRLDETTAAQRILSYARVLVNLDVTNPNPKSIFVDLEGDTKVEVEVQYKNIPYLECLSAGHLTAKSPFAAKWGILRTPAPVTMYEPPAISRDGDLNNLAAVDGTSGLRSVPSSVAEVSGDSGIAFPLATKSVAATNEIPTRTMAPQISALVPTIEGH